MEVALPDVVNEDVAPMNAGLEFLLVSLRRVLARRGYTGEQAEKKVEELLQRDFPRLTAAMMSAERPKE